VLSAVQNHRNQLQNFDQVACLDDDQRELAVVKRSIGHDLFEPTDGIRQSQKEHGSFAVICAAVIFKVHLDRLDLRQKFGAFDKVGQISEQRLDLRRHAVREFSQQTAGCDVDEPVLARLTDIHLDGLALGNHLGGANRIFARNLQCPGIVVRRPGRNDTELRAMLQRCDSVDDLIDRAVAAGCNDQVETGFSSTLGLVFSGIRLRRRGICARFVAGPLQNIQNVDKIVFHCFPA